MSLERLWEFALERGNDGFTIDEAQEQCEISYTQAKNLIRELRLMFGEDDINLVCDPQGQRQRWQYRLVAGYEGQERWHSNRIEDSRRRLETMHAVMTSAVNGTDGRTLAGKKARIMEMALRHLEENLRELEHSFEM